MLSAPRSSASPPSPSPETPGRPPHSGAAPETYARSSPPPSECSPAGRGGRIREGREERRDGGEDGWRGEEENRGVAVMRGEEVGKGEERKGGQENRGEEGK